MADRIHYVVIAKFLLKKGKMGEYDFISIEKEFYNEEPIKARDEAFNHYESLVRFLLKEKGVEYVNDKQAREELHTFIDPKTSTKIKHSDIIRMSGKDLPDDFEEKEYSIPDSLGNGMGVFIVFDDKEPTEFDLRFGELSSWNRSILHGIGSLMEGYSSPETFTLGLEEEWGTYQGNNYKTNDQETNIVFCDRDEWLEGYRDDEPHTYTILKTPFDWTGMDKPYWWGEPSEEDQEESGTDISFEATIAEGESHQVEFKPALLYNFKTKAGGIGIKHVIAKNICAFLNSDGGILFIGVNDDGNIQGLDYDFSLAGEKQAKDYFRLEFDSLLMHFLPKFTVTNISGSFITVQGKEIFVIIVHPSKSRPAFLNGQYGEEFWVRLNASTIQYKEIDDIAYYCIEHWNNAE